MNICAGTIINLKQCKEIIIVGVKFIVSPGINKDVEQDQIINNDRGSAFIITGPASRSNIHIIASNKMRKLFE